MFTHKNSFGAITKYHDIFQTDSESALARVKIHGIADVFRLSNHDRTKNLFFFGDKKTIAFLASEMKLEMFRITENSKI